MIKAERHDLILSELGKRGSIGVDKLAGVLGVSPATVRRDLGELHDAGLLRRTHGGAVLNDNHHEQPYQHKVTAFLPEKRRIGAAAASMIPPGRVIGCCGGTTVTQVIKALQGKRATVVTNAINVAAELTAATDMEVVVTGGTLRHRSYEVIGHVAEQTIRQFRLDIALIGVDGFSLEDGLTTYSHAEAHINRVLIECAREIWVVTDHSKLGRVRPAVIAPISRVDLLVTDRDAPASFIADVEAQGIRTIIC